MEDLVMPQSRFAAYECKTRRAAYLKNYANDGFCYTCKEVSAIKRPNGRRLPAVSPRATIMQEIIQN
jgi:hypothetical protein